MNFEYINRLIYRPIWQQNIICLIVAMIFGGSYFFFITAKLEQYELVSESITYQQDKNEVLQAKIAKYASLQALSAQLQEQQVKVIQEALISISAPTFESLFAKWVSVNSLRLSYFQPLDRENYHLNKGSDLCRWQIELQGDYLSFMQLLETMIQQRLNIHFDQIQINKNKMVITVQHAMHQ